MIKNERTVLVTGAAGYLGSWIVDYLLREKYTVHATVRNLNDNSKIKHMKEMKEKFLDNLVLYEADLLIPDDFDEAMKSHSCCFSVFFRRAEKYSN